MATTSDLRKGMLIRYNNMLYRVVEYQHINPGNWRAFVRLRLKNFENGKVIEDRVRAGSEIEIVNTQTRTAQYQYKAGTTYHFMDTDNYDQIELAEDVIGDSMQFVKADDSVSLLVLDDGQIIDIEPPTFVTLEVTAAEAAVRGDTANNITKGVTLETGAIVQVPAFINVGDLLKIDTRSGEYVERVRK